MLERAHRLKIRLLAERDSQGRYRVYFEPSDIMVVTEIFRGTTWIPRCIPPQVRIPYHVPTVTDIPYDYDEKTTPLYSRVSDTTIGHVTFFGADDVPARELRKIEKGIRKIRGYDSPLEVEIDAVAKLAGSGYFVNIERGKTYLYREGQ